MTLRQTFTGRRPISAGAGTRTCYTPRATGGQQWLARNRGGRCEWSAETIHSDVLVTKLCIDMAINPEHLPQNKRRGPKPSSPYTRQQIARTRDSAMGTRRTQVSNTDGREKKCTSPLVPSSGQPAPALALSVVSAAFGLTGCGTHGGGRRR